MSSQSRFIIGTAGHVDHGKTALVRRLTGINTDRWREEQERGLTIDLGFAYFDLPSGERVGFVDVPGHERFIHNMLAGVTNIDAVLLVVAADEGVRPQTAEHVAILDLLGISCGLVVLTKADRADEELLELVREDVEQLLAPTSLAGSPVIVTSAATGQGFDELATALDALAAKAEPHDIDGPARMPLDRSFTLPGHGTVVTGSLVRGCLTEGQDVEIIPAGLRARVRRLEVHGESLRTVAAPARVGVNLADVATGDLGRGDQLVEPGSMRVTWLLDCELRLIPSAPAPLKQRARVRLHISTAEVNASLLLLDGRRELQPGDICFTQLQLEQPVAAAPGDRFVIRGSSPLMTLGGGVVLDPRPRRHRAGREEVLSALRALKEGSVVDRALQTLARRGTRGMTADELRREMQLTAEATTALLARAEEENQAQSLGGVWVVAEHAAALRDAVLSSLEDYQSSHPLQPGMPLRDLQVSTHLEAQPLQDLLASLVSEGALVVESGRVRLAGRSATPSPEQQQRIDALLDELRRARFQPPTRDAALERLGGGQEAPDLLAYLVEGGAVVPLGDLVFAPETLDEAKKLLREALGGRTFTVADARDVLGSTRKYVVPLLEYLDRSGFTLRRGDERGFRDE